MGILLLSSILILFFPSQSKAQALESGVCLLCETRSKISFTNPLAEFQTGLCIKIKEELKCEAHAKTDGNYTNLIKTCTPEEIREQVSSQNQALLSCLSGAYQAAIGDLIDYAWTAAKNNLEMKNSFIRACDQSDECRFQLAKDSNLFRNLPISEIQKIPTATLYIEAKDSLDYRNQMRVLGKATASESSAKFSNNKSVSPSENTRALPLLSIATNYVKEKGIKLACLKPQAQSEMICYGLMQAIGIVVPAKWAATNTYKLFKVGHLDAQAFKTGASTEAILISKTKPIQLSKGLGKKEPVLDSKNLSLSEKNLYLFEPAPYQYAEDIVASNGAPVFNISGINATKEITKMKTIAGQTFDDLSQFMQACKGSWGKGVKGSCVGFIQNGEKLKDVLIRDNDFVLSKGLTHQKVAAPLLKLMQEFEKLGYTSTKKKSILVRLNGKEFEVIGNRRAEGHIFGDGQINSGWIGEARANGLQGSPFTNDQIYNTWEFIIKDPTSRKIFKGEGLTPHLIHRYGFYQSGPFRMDPQQIIEFFNISP